MIKSPEGLEIQNRASNMERLKRVRQQKNLYTMGSAATVATGLALGLTASSTGLLLLGPALDAINTLNKYVRIEKVSELLLQEFNGLDIQVFPALEMMADGDFQRKYNQVDLYVRFPKKTQIFITIRSMGKNTVVYSEAKESLLIKRSRGRTNEVQPCPLVGLNENKQWLVKNRKAFDLSSNQVLKTATAKILVIWNETKLADHRQELYSHIGQEKYLTLFKGGTKTFVVEKERLANFVRDWLTQLSD